MSKFFVIIATIFILMFGISGCQSSPVNATSKEEVMSNQMAASEQTTSSDTPRTQSSFNTNIELSSNDKTKESETVSSSSAISEISNEEMLQLIEGDWTGVSREWHGVCVMTWQDDSPSHKKGEEEADDGLCLTDDYSGTLSISGNMIVNHGEEYYADEGQERSISETNHEIIGMEEVSSKAIVNDLRYYGKDEVQDTYSEKAYSFNLAHIDSDNLPAPFEILQKNCLYYFVDDGNSEHLIWYREFQRGKPYERAYGGHPRSDINYTVVKYHWIR